MATAKVAGGRGWEVAARGWAEVGWEMEAAARGWAVVATARAARAVGTALAAAVMGSEEEAKVREVAGSPAAACGALQRSLLSSARDRCTGQRPRRRRCDVARRQQRLGRPLRLQAGERSSRQR